MPLHFLQTTNPHPFSFNFHYHCVCNPKRKSIAVHNAMPVATEMRLEGSISLEREKRKNGEAGGEGDGISKGKINGVPARYHFAARPV